MPWSGMMCGRASQAGVAGAVTVSVVLGLVLQGIAVAVMHWAVRGHWLRHTGALLLAAAVTYHGLTEIVQVLFPGWNHYRDLVTQKQIDDWMVVVSPALLLYAIGYALVAFGAKGGNEPPPPVSVEGLSLKWMLLLATPLTVLSLQGFAFQVGDGDPSKAAAGSDYLVTGLVGQFVTLLIPLCAALAIIKLDKRWVLPILALQAALMSTIGARNLIVVSCVMALYGAALAGVRIPRKQLVGAGLVVVLLAMSISVSRDIEGRQFFASSTGPAARLELLGEGFTKIPTDFGKQAILGDFVYRFDGNNFGAAVLDAMSHGTEPVGVTTLRNSVLLAVPSFLYPEKLQTSVADRSEKDYFSGHFGLSTSYDLLPTIWGALLGYGGPLVLLLTSFLLGIGVRLIDRKVVRGTSPIHFVLGLGLAQFVLSYERGPQAFFVQFRGVLLIMALVWAIGLWRDRRSKPEPPIPDVIRQAQTSNAAGPRAASAPTG